MKGLQIPGLALVLLAIAGCTPHDPIPDRLEARLKAIVAVPRADLSPDDVEQALARQLRSAPLPAAGGRDPASQTFPTRETLAQFYAQNGHRLAWCDDSGKLTASTKTLLDVLRRAGEHGLDPEDYALSRLDLLGAQIGRAPFDDAAVARLADFDLLMTAALFRYASDLSTGRVHPDEIRNDWHTNVPESNRLTGLTQAVATGQLATFLEGLQPPHAGYARLRHALAELQAVEAAGGWTGVPEGPKLARGSRGPRVTLLRQRLLLPPGELFDEAVAEAVRRFQERHGLEPDGKVGATTLNELNVPVATRIRQVELNLERWRWIPRELGDPHVFVNIPGFELTLVRGADVAWRTRIVVGKAFTPTPVFSDRIVEVIANPPWNVPESIAIGEYLPELRKDKTALSRHGLVLLKGGEKDAREVDPTTVDWKALGEDHFPYRIRQDPGPANALGRVKFQLTNAFNVYLHDTPTRSLFGKSDRDLSHGCMRVEKPLELATQILGEAAQAPLREALDQTEERHLSVKPPVPIHIVYLTAWVDDDDALRFSPDIYEFDGPQRKALDHVSARLIGGPASGAKESAQPEAR